MRLTFRSFLFIIFIFFFHTGNAGQNTDSAADAIVGSWLMPDDEGIIEIFKENDTYGGKLIWLKEKEADGSPLKDHKNPVDSLRQRPIVGLKIMDGFRYVGDNKWSDGVFYAAKKGKYVEPDFILRDPNHLDIKVSLFIFSMTINLTRIDTTEFFNRVNKTD